MRNGDGRRARLPTALLHRLKIFGSPDDIKASQRLPNLLLIRFGLENPEPFRPFAGIAKSHQRQCGVGRTVAAASFSAVSKA